MKFNLNALPKYRLWMINQYAVTREMSSGTRHVELASELEKHGWETTIFAGRSQITADQSPSKRHWSKLFTYQSVGEASRFISAFCVSHSNNGVGRYFNMLSFALTSFLSSFSVARPHLVIGSSPQLLAALSGLVIAKTRRVPFVLEVRDMWPDTLLQLGLRNPLIIGVLTRIERVLYRHATAIIALTEGIRDRIIAKGIDEDKVVVIPNASLQSPELDDESRRRTRERLGWQNRCIVVWPGAHNPANGLEHVVGAALQLGNRTDIRFIFIGTGTVKRALIDLADGSPNIEFWDPVPKRDLAEILRAADIGILNSKSFDAFEGARPNKLFEYMANGVAIVNSIPGEAARLVAEADAGLAVQWENPSSIAEGILRLADNPQMREDMGRRGYKYVREFHSREQTAEVLHQLLSEIVASRSGR